MTTQHDSQCGCQQCYRDNQEESVGRKRKPISAEIANYPPEDVYPGTDAVLDEVAEKLKKACAKAEAGIEQDEADLAAYRKKYPASDPPRQEPQAPPAKRGRKPKDHRKALADAAYALIEAVDASPADEQSKDRAERALAGIVRLVERLEHEMALPVSSQPRAIEALMSYAAEEDPEEPRVPLFGAL
jgi:hypothetical protein